MRVFSPAYITTLAVTFAAATVLCVAGRRHRGVDAAHPARWILVANALLALALLVTSGLWLATTLGNQPFTAANSLPFALCDVAALVAAAALLSRQRLLVEITYFWGLAGSLQSLITPDLKLGWPSLEFVEYVVAHAAIVCAALFLVVGQGLVPRRRAVLRIWLITLAYSGFVGAVDALTGGNYMYLRHVPSEWTLLSVLGPWPWYIASAAAVALVLFTLLDLPFWKGRRDPRASVQPVRARGDGTRRRSASNNPTGRTDARSPQTVGQSTGAVGATTVRGTSSGTDPTQAK
ncbi:MAG TPA: TIGR02206 family membrane protein [Acidimicrobiales bacterium]|nr:TIGR02206 family membrane protein [Acidimicrobiales bacterium]